MEAGWGRVVRPAPMRMVRRAVGGVEMCLVVTVMESLAGRLVRRTVELGRIHLMVHEMMRVEGVPSVAHPTPSVPLLATCVRRLASVP